MNSFDMLQVRTEIPASPSIEDNASLFDQSQDFQSHVPVNGASDSLSSSPASSLSACQFNLRDNGPYPLTFQSLSLDSDLDVHSEQHAPPCPDGYADTTSSRMSRNVPAETEPAQLFACPYTKHDALRYSASNLQELNYRGCGQCYLTDISRLKQHLYRVHERPHYYCPTCYSSFKNQEKYERHVVARSCEVKTCPFDEKMTPEQLAIIKKKNRGTDPYVCWYDIYATLFPGESKPSSPYASFTSAAVPASLDLFMQFVEDRAPQRVRQQLIGSRILDESTQGHLLMSVESSLSNTLRDLRKEFDLSMQSHRSRASSSVSLGFQQEEDEHGRRSKRQRRAHEPALPTFQYQIDTQSIPSFDVSGRQSYSSTPNMLEDEAVQYRRHRLRSPAGRYVAPIGQHEPMQNVIPDQMTRMVESDPRWQPALRPAEEQPGFYLSGPQPTAGSQQMFYPQGEEWRATIITPTTTSSMEVGEQNANVTGRSTYMGDGWSYDI